MAGSQLPTHPSDFQEADHFSTTTTRILVVHISRGKIYIWQWRGTPPPVQGNLRIAKSYPQLRVICFSVVDDISSMNRISLKSEGEKNSVLYSKFDLLFRRFGFYPDHSTSNSCAKEQFFQLLVFDFHTGLLFRVIYLIAISSKFDEEKIVLCLRSRK